MGSRGQKDIADGIGYNKSYKTCRNFQRGQVPMPAHYYPLHAWLFRTRMNEWIFLVKKSRASSLCTNSSSVVILIPRSIAWLRRPVISALYRNSKRNSRTLILHRRVQEWSCIAPFFAILRAVR